MRLQHIAACILLTQHILWASETPKDRAIETEKQLFSINEKTVRIMILNFTNDRVTFLNENLEKKTHPIADFSLDDSQYLYEKATKNTKIKIDSSSTPTLLNFLLDEPLFSDDYLWDDQDDQIANRLNLSLESKTNRSARYNRYLRPGENLSIANIHSISLGIEFKNPKIIDITLTNKGSFISYSKKVFKYIEGDKIEKAEHQMKKELSKALKQNESYFSETLNKILGPSQPIRIRRHSGSYRIKKWEWNRHHFYLTEIPNEFVKLTISKELLNNGKPAIVRYRDQEIKKKIRQNIVHTNNGDIILKNIPMVDQGNKAYCVPATFSRYLQFMGMPSCIHELAADGKTNYGGTIPSNMKEGSKRDIAYNGRKIKTKKLKCTPNSLKKHIDRGLPIIWCMNSSPLLNDLADQWTADRLRVKNWNAWQAYVKKHAGNTKDLKKSEFYPHVCLIIGYNQKTREIAISDSWGMAYSCRWIPMSYAQSVSLEEFYIIDF